MSGVIDPEFEKRCKEYLERALRIAETDSLPVAIKALRGGDALSDTARDLKVSCEAVNSIQRGRFELIARIGELLPSKQGQGGGRGKKKLPLPDRRSLFASQTVADYRKVAAQRDKIDPYFEAEHDEAKSVGGFLNWVGSGGMIATTNRGGNIEWYTPAKYVSLAREVMGAIDLDPASCEAAQETVKAGEFFSADDDGLSREWSGRVFLNPPYRQPLCQQFVTKLCESHESGAVSQAVLLTNDQTDTAWWQQGARAADAICFVDGRIKFYNAAGEGQSPTNGQTFCYYGGRKQKFAKAFSEVGLVVSQI